MNFEDRVVVVTGAASGIGRELALAFARRGAKLAVADIDVEGLQKVQDELASLGCEVYTQIVDVSVAEQVKDFCDNVYQEMNRVDVLCNNAGIGVAGFVEDIPLEVWERIFGINLWGIIYGCLFFYPRMIEQGGGGHIVNTSSACGLFPLPLTIPYNTTKYAITGLSETLRAEAALHGIGVSAVCPGIVATNAVRSGRTYSNTKHSSPDEIREKLDRFYTRRNFTPDRVAAAVVKGVEKNKGVIVVGIETHIGDFLYRLNRAFFGSMIKSAYRSIQKWG
jgi:NAD(P)-dependent dehydrogenase (short-subunit alcohol dehydrogenase family)